MIVDLHCHSTHSDGVLTPQQLVTLAEKNNIEILAITDHDNIDAYQDLAKIKTKVKLVTGVEFSTTWSRIGIHIVALNFDINAQNMQQAVAFQAKARISRAKIISQKLEKYGVFNAYEKVLTANENKQIGRPDFARLLVKEGVAKDFAQAFKKFLGAGKRGDVKNQWLSMEEIINVTKLAGGVAVLAHPLYYKLTNNKLNRLVQHFKDSGGIGIEVINGKQNPEKIEYLLKLCKQFNLQASIGSDFHQSTSWNHLGYNSKLIGNVATVWDDFI
ncbi:COG0613, Predicted metal-dependent phosphoesterases (PHP family) [hydrothermal vent metagenome]|uniref:COG0613, Predicted metal-dependent phosphoesterases (PHP family) n=1 Tax=hydrothermal vent metagenome TaxID=652676 RepID=A0A3B0WGK5_9ZZZZ